MALGSSVVRAHAGITLRELQLRTAASNGSRERLDLSQIMGCYL